MSNEFRVMNKVMSQAGFSVLEILVAMFILTLSISAVVLVSFGNQSIVADSQDSVEALNIAQGLLENEQSLARKDFRLVNPSSATEDIYQKTLTVTQPNYFTKQLTATVSWDGGPGRPLSSSLSLMVTNFENAIGGNTCYSELLPGDDWAHPKKLSFDFASLVADSGGVYPITDMDAYNNKLYVTVNNSSANSKETFFIFDISSPSNPVLRGKLDNAASVSAGLNAVAVAQYPPTNKVYAYVASGRSISSAASFGQLQILDVTDPQNPFVAATLKIPNVTGTAGQGIGNSIFYHNGYVYLGLTTTGSGPEFNIVDVHDPLNPFLLTAELPYNFLKYVSQRITNEIREVGGVVYRISDKPPVTIEWG